MSARLKEKYSGHSYLGLKIQSKNEKLNRSITWTVVSILYLLNSLYDLIPSYMNEKNFGTKKKMITKINYFNI